MIYTVTLSPALDKSYTIGGFAAGKVNRVAEVRSDPGGKGINVSKTIRSLGGASVALGIAGGQTGQLILNQLDALQIPHDFIEGSHETRTNIKISDPISGATTDINEPAHIEKNECDALLNRLLKKLKPGDTVLIAGRIDAETCDIAAWIVRIKSLHARVFLDTAGEALSRGVTSAPFLIKPNREEFEALLGEACKSTEEVAKRALQLQTKTGIEYIAVSLGEEGALFAHRGEAWYATAPAVTPVSTVGAGDAMCAALCFALDGGLSEANAYRLALACGSAAVCCPGSQSPEREQIEALLPEIRLRRIL